MLVLRQQFAEGEFDGAVHQPFDAELPVEGFVVFDFGDVAVVADVEELGAGQEAFVEEIGEGGFDVEGVDAG